MAMEALRIAAKESKFMKFFLGAFIALAVGGLVFTDVHGFFTGGMGNTTVAKVNGTEIDIREFDRDLRSILSQAGLSTEDAYAFGLVDNVLQSRVNSLLQLQASEDLNIHMDNRAIAREIRQAFGPDAQRDQIEMALRAQGLTTDQFAASIRSQAAVSIISQLPGAVSGYAPNFVQQINSKIDSETRDAVIYAIPLDRITDYAELTDQDIVDYYAANMDEFMISETRVFQIGRMSLDMAKETLPTIKDDDVRNEYDSRIYDFVIPETRSLRQVQLEDADAAQELYTIALETGDLESAIAQLELEAELGEESAFEYDGLPPEIADRAFDNQVEEGEILPPTETIFGYIVAVVTKITPETTRPFEEVRAELREEMEKNAIYDALYNKIIDTENMIDGGQSFEEVAELTGLEVETTTALNRNELADSETLKAVIDASPSVADEIFGLPEGTAAYPIEVDDEHYVVIGVQSITPQSAKPLEDVREDIVTRLTQSRINTAAQSNLQTIIENLRNGTLTTNDLRESYAATSRNVSSVKRNTENANANLIFNTNNGDYNYRIDSDNAIIAHVTKISFDANTDPDETSSEAIQRQQRGILDSLLSFHYRDNASIWINEKLLRQQYSGQRQ